MANELLDSMLVTLEKHLNTKTVVGDPITLGNVTMIPVMDLMFGYGGGAGEGRDEKQGGSGGGGGVGARMSAKAMIVLKDGEVSVLPLGKGGAIDKIVDSIPGLVEKLGPMKPAKAEKEAEAE